MANLITSTSGKKKALIEMKTYKLICKNFGHQFSFNARGLEKAEDKKREWCRYHSFIHSDFSIEETTDQKWMHNEYISLS